VSRHRELVPSRSTRVSLGDVGEQRSRGGTVPAGFWNGTLIPRLLEAGHGNFTKQQWDIDGCFVITVNCDAREVLASPTGRGMMRCFREVERRNRNRCISAN
jgi:hypothetical protein